MCSVCESTAPCSTDFTMLFPLRGRTLYRLSRHADRDQLPGALVDCGTYNGGSTALLAAGAPKRNVWAFDSFEGLPAPSVRDTTDGKLDLAAANAIKGCASAARSACVRRLPDTRRLRRRT
jgi:Macrocin-O-methyltransferase (TylF)